MADDLLPVCNNMHVPLQDFEAQFCSRCYNPECSRSRAGKLKFDDRVAKWYDRLFKNPEVMDRNDPRFADISAQRFLEIPVGAPLVINTGAPAEPKAQSPWIDPRDLEAPAEKPKPKPRKAAASPPSPQEPLVDEPAEEPQTTPAESPKQVAKPRGPLQTPFKQGTMLSGETPKTQVEKDPWAATPAQKAPEGSQPMKPGGKFRFGK